MGLLSWLFEFTRENKDKQQKILSIRRRFPTAKLAPSVEVRNPDRLELGENVIIDMNVLLHCGGSAWSDGRGSIRIGNNCYIGPNTVLFGAGDIEIGNDVLVSPNVTITSHQHTFADNAKPIRLQPIEFKKVVIEDNVWIGSNAVILPGVTVGRDSVLGAGAVANKDVPAGSLVGGIPAVLIKSLR
ncbi:MAG: acyltransferase [Candidatus Abyssobacteria bacterium SURF_17]|uniref:Acyltransferase n=1 Tax=Candidatus Abyssobacteria bacterium SURF_17 TaxID=2093361 RepID=A0A419EZX3_9BACT|nr:MAG: acyltransferase [Candidatus Abyssubacteria bacterium SURF_17]